MMTSNFISLVLDGLTLFSCIKNLYNKYKCLYYSKSFGRISFHVMTENWQHLKATLAFSLFLCVRIEIVLLTSDLLPNISLVVGLSSVNISLTLQAREIPTSRLTSKQ